MSIFSEPKLNLHEVPQRAGFDCAVGRVLSGEGFNNHALTFRSIWAKGYFYVGKNGQVQMHKIFIEADDLILHIGIQSNGGNFFWFGEKRIKRRYCYYKAGLILKGPAFMFVTPYFFMRLPPADWRARRTWIS